MNEDELDRRKKIMEWAQKDSIVYYFFRLHAKGKLSYEEFLQVTLLAVLDDKGATEKALQDAYHLSTKPLHIEGLNTWAVPDDSNKKETIRTIANVATVIISLCLLVLTMKQLGWF